MRGGAGDRLAQLATDVLWIAAVVAAPLLPAPWGALALALLAIFWIALRRSLEALAIAALVLVAAGLLGAESLSSLTRSSPRAERQAERADYALLWKGLHAEARRAAARVGRPAETLEARLRAFDVLHEVAKAEVPGRRALLLLDPDGAPVAWAGEGVLHELPAEIPARGALYNAGFGAATLLAVEPLDGARRPWRVVAGASFATDRLPFGSGRRVRWALLDAGQPAAAGAARLEVAGAPSLVLGPAAVSGAVGAVGAPNSPIAPERRRQAGWVLAAALFLVAASRALGTVLPAAEPLSPARPEPRFRAEILWALGAAAALALAQEVPLRALGVLLAGGLVLALGLAFGGRRPPSRLVALLEVAVLLVAALAALWAFDLRPKPADLSAGVFVSAEAWVLRLGWTSALLGALFGLSRQGREDGQADRWGWIAGGLMLAGVASAERPWLALLLLAFGLAALLEARLRRPANSVAVPITLILLGSLAAAGLWETAHRTALRRTVPSELLERLSPPEPAELRRVGMEVRRHFAKHDLAKLAPRPPAGLDRQDLAFTFWRDSPLARLHALSALVIRPFEGTASSFSYGLPLTEEGEIDDQSQRWEDLRLPLWDGLLVAGEGTLQSAGRPWGTVRYWLLPRPGFEAEDPQRLADVEVGLLRGGPSTATTEAIATPAVFALYDRSSRAALSPWEEEPPLAPDLLAGGGELRSSRLHTPDGKRATAWSRASSEGWEVLYLPDLLPVEALERAGNWTLGVLGLLALAATPILLLALPRAAFRSLLSRTLRSYSKKLVIVYTLLLLAPLALLNVALVRSMDQRLEREQRATGEAALGSLQTLLNQRLLTQPPGFGVDTAFGDQLLVDFAGILHREFNLYWVSGLHASSRHELFTAGLLPSRIPGEIYRRLALVGYGQASRYNRVAGANYLEMYAPLRVPGEGPGAPSLFLSMPLLAQQEEAARQLGQLRRHALLVTAALFALLVAVGRQLGRNFTTPLMQLVEGTKRIAAGATSLNLSPTELELASLVQAVDEMALRIAETHGRLVREKQVIERMVENITSGVVSLDRGRRVLLHNRVAEQLLGTRVGESLEEAVERSEKLAPVADFLRALRRGGPGGPGGEMERASVRLTGETGGEQEWQLVWVPVPGEGEPTALLVVEDATEVLRGQRLQAWAEMARMIAHEIKNPLTPIRLTAEHMREVYHRDPERFGEIFERCVTNILKQVEELRSIASEFSAYSSIPRIEPKVGDLVESVRELVEGYRAAPPPGVTVDFESGPETLRLRFDAKLLSRAFRNLIENALRASQGGGRVEVRIEERPEAAVVTVLDSGPGVEPDLLARIFDPYFSTHDTGTGLGLPIARRIVEEHGGTITAQNRSTSALSVGERGLEATVVLPL